MPPSSSRRAHPLTPPHVSDACLIGFVGSWVMALAQSLMDQTDTLTGKVAYLEVRGRVSAALPPCAR